MRPCCVCREVEDAYSDGTVCKYGTGHFVCDTCLDRAVQRGLHGGSYNVLAGLCCPAPGCNNMFSFKRVCAHSSQGTIQALARTLRAVTESQGRT